MKHLYLSFQSRFLCRFWRGTDANCEQPTSTHLSRSEEPRPPLKKAEQLDTGCNFFQYAAVLSLPLVRRPSKIHWCMCLKSHHQAKGLPMISPWKYRPKHCMLFSAVPFRMVPTILVGTITNPLGYENASYVHVWKLSPWNGNDSTRDSRLTAKCLKGGAGDIVEAHSSKDVKTEGVQVILFFFFPWLHHWRGKNNNPWGTSQKSTTSPSCLFTLSSFSHFLATDFSSNQNWLNPLKEASTNITVV